MTIKNRLRNNLIMKIQKMSTDKLTEMNNLVSKLENENNLVDNTLNLAGSWKNLGDDFFVNLNEKLHDHRTNKDRQIN